MEIMFWVIVTVIVFAIAVYVLRFGKRQEVLDREPARPDVAPDTKEHGIDLQARRKLYDDAT